MVGKLCSSRRQQNALASAIKEYGALRRTVYARYLADETYRRRIGRQLNKGENLHALKRSLAYAGEGSDRPPAPRAAGRADVVPDPRDQRSSDSGPRSTTSRTPRRARGRRAPR